MEENTTAVLNQLETAGITLAHIPPGLYSVGYEGNNEPLLTRPPGIDFIEPTHTPLTKVSTNGFYITHDVMRLSHWHKLTALAPFSNLKNLLSQEILTTIAERKTSTESIFVQHSADEVQFRGTSLEPFEIPRQPEPDPALSVTAETAELITNQLNAFLPRWNEWEIATRGPDSLMYPWGNELDLSSLSIEHQDYSVEDEGVMGYYRYDQEVYFIHSFGPYRDQPSPFGLIGLARPGQEWNLSHEGTSLDDQSHLLRSLSDLGDMAMMIPGNRPNTWPFGGWLKTKAHLAFSGPSLVCYAPANVGQNYKKPLYKTAAFRLVFRP